MIAIRQARVADRRKIQGIFASAIRRLAKGFYTRKQIRVWSGRLTPEKLTVPIALGRVFVADIDGTLAGFAQIDISTGEVEAVYVSPKYARHGVGTMLLHFVECLAHNSGLSFVHLRSSMNALPFYKKAGFEEIERILYQLEDGTEFDCVNMRKDLRQMQAC